jgi:3-hydroxyisobutyrate dehydrogenase-like beta-hydroxyacid dehydrogenase
MRCKRTTPDEKAEVSLCAGRFQNILLANPWRDTGREKRYMGASGMGTTMKLVVNTLLGLGMQALAESIALGEKAGLEKGLLLDVLDQTAVLTPGQKSKLDNVRQEQYPTTFVDDHK